VPGRWPITRRGRAASRATAGKPTPGVAVEPGLVGHWTLDDGEGEVATDSSGLGNDAEVLGRWVTGQFGTCVFTGGIPGAVTIKDGPLVRFGMSDFSMSFWVKPDAWNCRLLGKEDFPKCWWVINLVESGRAELVLGKGTKRRRRSGRQRTRSFPPRTGRT